MPRPRCPATAVNAANVAGLQRVSASATRAAALARQRYAGGTATLIDTLDAERQRFNTEQTLAQAEAELTQDFVRLQKSLGPGMGSVIGYGPVCQDRPP